MLCLMMKNCHQRAKSAVAAAVVTAEVIDALAAPSACGDIPDELDVAVDDNNRMRASAAGLPPV